MGEELLVEMGTSGRCSRADPRSLPRAGYHREDSAQPRWQVQQSPASNSQTSTVSFELEQIHSTALALCQAKKQGRVLWLPAGPLH